MNNFGVTMSNKSVFNKNVFNKNMFNHNVFSKSVLPKSMIANKKNILSLGFLSLLGVFDVATAQYDGGILSFPLDFDRPLVVKSSGPGFTFAEAVRSETCTVYRNRVIIEKQFGGGENRFETTQIVLHSVSDGIDSVIKKSAAEHLEVGSNYICDLPSTSIYSFQGKSQVTLFRSGGCGSPREEREGVFSKMLVDLVDQFCPQTNDFDFDIPFDVELEKK